MARRTNPDYGVPNLDAMEAQELWDFGMEFGHFGNRKTALVLFPEKPAGYVKVARFLGHYATNKSVAMKERKKGNIQAAQIYETIADNIYDELPDWAKW